LKIADEAFPIVWSTTGVYTDYELRSFAGLSGGVKWKGLYAWNPAACGEMHLLKQSCEKSFG